MELIRISKSIYQIQCGLFKVIDYYIFFSVVFVLVIFIQLSICVENVDYSIGLGVIFDG